MTHPDHKESIKSNNIAGGHVISHRALEPMENQWIWLGIHVSILVHSQEGFHLWRQKGTNRGYTCLNHSASKTLIYVPTKYGFLNSEIKRALKTERVSSSTWLWTWTCLSSFEITESKWNDLNSFIYSHILHWRNISTLECGTVIDLAACVLEYIVYTQYYFY